MSYTRRIALLCWTAALATLLIVGCGCGSRSSAPKGPTSITPAQATAASLQVQTTLVAAVTEVTSAICPLPPCCNINTEAPCTPPVVVEVPCAGGGTISLSGSLSGLMNFYGTSFGPADGALTFTPTNCSIPGSSLAMNGTGLALNSQVYFLYNRSSAFTITETGPFSYGPSPSGSCQVNLTALANIDDNSRALTACTVSGTACGQAINKSCL